MKSKLGLAIMALGFLLMLLLTLIWGIDLSWIGLCFYFIGFVAYRLQCKGREREEALAVMAKTNRDDNTAEVKELKQVQRDKEQRRERWLLKLVGLLAMLLFPFYDKLVELLLAALLFGEGNVGLIVRSLIIAFSVAFIVGTVAIIVEDYLETRNGNQDETESFVKAATKSKEEEKV